MQSFIEVTPKIKHLQSNCINDSNQSNSVTYSILGHSAKCNQIRINFPMFTKNHFLNFDEM